MKDIRRAVSSPHVAFPRKDVLATALSVAVKGRAAA